MIITIDGPAGAGKSTVARLLAERLAFDFLDTGAMYRAVTWGALRGNVAADDAEAVAALLQSLDVTAIGGRTCVNGVDVSEAIRTPEITARVRPFADHPLVRSYLVECQRRVGIGRDLVTEGRDQGTIVFPAAECKFYLTADPLERARRRQQDFTRQGRSIAVEDILAEQSRRDEEDATRALAPLRQAADAEVIDTTHLSIDETVACLLEKVRAKRRAIASDAGHTPTADAFPHGRFVVIETSGLCGAVAVAEATRLLAIRQLTAARKHARDLIPALKELLEEQQWPTFTVDAVFVDVGPGSYTGLRVGVMAAKTWAYATKASVVAVDGMAVLAEGAPPEAARVWTIVDAQQGLLYAACFERRGAEERWELCRATEIVAATEWAAWLEAGDYVTGPALAHADSLLSPIVRVAPPNERQPTVRSCWTVGLRAYLAGERSDPWTLEPLYLRPSAAETKWEQRQAGPST